MKSIIKKSAIYLVVKANSVYLSELFRSGKVYLAFLLFVFVITAPVDYWTTYAPKYFLDTIVNDKNLHMALMWILAMLALRISDNVLRFIQEMLRTRATSNAQLKAKKYTYDRIKYIYITFFDDPSNLSMYDKALTYNESGGEAFLNLAVNLIRSIIGFFTMTYISMQFEWWLWIIIIALIIVQFFTDKYMTKISFKYNMERINRDRKQNYYNGLPTNKPVLAEIKLNSTMEFFFNKYQEAFISNRRKNEKQQIKMKILGFLFDLPNVFFSFICYFVIGHGILKGTSTIGDYTLFFTMITSISSQIKSVISCVNSFYEQSLSAKVYLDFINQTDNYVPNSSALLLDCTAVEMIEFKNVSFTYPGSSVKAVDNISIKIGKGEKITVVGFNGAGKTTFVNLMSLLFFPTSGDVYINGIPSSDIEAKSYWSKIGVVFQNHQEFCMSIKDNVLLRESTDENEALIWRILERIGLDKKIQNTSQGLDLQLTRNFDENGMDLSGGERQKLAIARIMAKNCDMYILDEPSSALDPVSEDAMYKCIEQMTIGKTVIMISHRLSSVYYSDRVLFFDNGKIIADGPHERIIKTCSKYKELYELQAQKYMQSKEDATPIES